MLHAPGSPTARFSVHPDYCLNADPICCGQHLEIGRCRTSLLLWLLLQAALARNGFYAITNTLPPRFALVVGPPLALWGRAICYSLGPPFSRTRLRLGSLTLLHVVRVPVELVLFGLYHYQAVPRLMTFEGRNWDILMGLTAPLIYYLAFRRRLMGRTGLVVWNIMGVVLLSNIVRLGLLSTPGPFQQLSFKQPNVALLHFPYVWLPAFVVPTVLLAHLAALRQLVGHTKVKMSNS